MDSARSKPKRAHHPGVRSDELAKRTRRWLIIAAIGLILLLFLFGGDGLWSSLILSGRVTQLEARIDSLESINRQMQRRIEGLKARDPEILEEEARSHGMIKPGEKVYIMHPESDRKDK